MTTTSARATAGGQSYRTCWLGFTIYGVNLAVASVVGVATILLQFSGQIPHLGYWLGIDSFDEHVETFRTWSRVLACVALAAAWPGNLGWKRRAGLLLILSVADVVLWGVVHAEALGLAEKPTRHLVFCHYLIMALGWSRFLLLADLASDFARHAGMPGAAEFGKAARSTATTGAAIWFLYFLCRIDWTRPWPLAERRLTMDVLQLLLACHMLTIVCLIQATFLTLLAARAAARTLREMAAEEKTALDPLFAPATDFEAAFRVPSFGHSHAEEPPRT